jgi:hypothetical protein
MAAKVAGRQASFVKGWVLRFQAHLLLTLQFAALRAAEL